MPSRQERSSFARALLGEYADVELPRGRHNLSRDQVRAVQRGRLLLGMAEAVAEKGYTQATVADVLARAGASRETFYEHFANKEECFLAAYEECARALGQTVTEASHGGGTPLERMRLMLDRYFEAMAAAPELTRLFLVEVYAAGPVAIARRIEVYEQFVDIMAAVLNADGALDALPNPDFTVRSLVGAVSMHVTMAVLQGASAELPQLTGPMLQLLDQLGLA